MTGFHQGPPKAGEAEQEGQPMNAMRVYTKHGLRAHYADFSAVSKRPLPPTPSRAQTFCGHDAYALSDRNRLFRRRLAQASVCSVCEKAEEQS